MKKIFIQTTLITSLLVPVFTYAQTDVTSLPVSATCAQSSIEKRDTAIATSRATYNASMTSALLARKEAEKLVVTIIDKDARKTAIKNAVTAYKTSAKNAQEELTTARKKAWETFEAEKKACKDVEPQASMTSSGTQQEDRRVGRKEEKEDSRKGEGQTITTSTQEDNTSSQEEQRSEMQKIRDSFKSQMKNLRSLFN